MVLVEGGLSAIMEVATAIRQGIPVLVFVETGRAANCIDYAYKHFQDFNNFDTLSE